MPLDPDALVALSDLAAPGARRSGSRGGPPRRPSRPREDRHREPEPGVPPATAMFRRRLAMLAAGSASAGLVLGVVVPGPAPTPIVPMAAAAAPGAVAAEPAMLLAASASPFAPAPVRAATLVAPAGKSTRKAAPTARTASTSAVGSPAAGIAAGTPSGPARIVAAAVVPAQVAAGASGATGPSGPTGVAGPAGADVAAVAALAPAYLPTRPLPAHSGTGRRIVYSETAAHLWVVGDDGAVIRDYAVSGRVGRPKPALCHVYSKSTVATNPGEKLRFEYMVRFAVGLTGARIGFHTIPRYLDGVPIQSENQLGRAIGSGGCVRQTRADAQWLYGWSRVGDTVVVLR